MKFNSQICTSREQSESLLALGLKKETADMVHIENIHHYNSAECKVEFFISPIDGLERLKENHIPAWSLHRLLLLLPKEIRIERNFYTIAVVNDSIQIVDDCGDIYRYFMSMNVYGELIDCIEWLIKEGYFNKEYLV